MMADNDRGRLQPHPLILSCLLGRELAIRHRVADNFTDLLEANQGVSSFAMTNRGLKIELPIVSIEDTGEIGAIMNFRVEKAEEENGFKFFGIYLWKGSDGTFARSRPLTLFMTDSIVGNVTYTTIYIAEPPLVENSLKSRPDWVPFLITHNTERGQKYVLTEKLPLYSGDYGDHFEQGVYFIGLSRKVLVQRHSCLDAQLLHKNLQYCSAFTMAKACGRKYSFGEIQI